MRDKSTRMKELARVFLTAAATLLAAPSGWCGPQQGGKAFEAAQKPAPKANPKSLQLNEQGVAAVKAREFGKAEHLFREALAVDPYNLTAVFNLAGMYATNNKPTEAITLLQEYVKKSPEDAGLHARLADVYFAAERPKEAAEYYEKALKLEPNYPKLYPRLATVYGLQNRLNDAEQALRMAVKEDPSNSELYGNLSAVQLANNNIQAAIGTAKKSLQLKASPDVYVTLGTAYEMSRSYKNALIAYQRAVDLGDERPELMKKIESLKKTEGME